VVDKRPEFIKLKEPSDIILYVQKAINRSFFNYPLIPPIILQFYPNYWRFPAISRLIFDGRNRMLRGI
jgi:hypothetical protein